MLDLSITPPIPTGAGAEDLTLGKMRVEMTVEELPVVIVSRKDGLRAAAIFFFSCLGKQHFFSSFISPTFTFIIFLISLEGIRMYNLQHFYLHGMKREKKRLSFKDTLLS